MSIPSNYTHFVGIEIPQQLFLNDCLIHHCKHNSFSFWVQMCRFQTSGSLRGQQNIAKHFHRHFELKCGLHKLNRNSHCHSQRWLQKNPASLTLGCYQSSSILLTTTSWLDIRTISITLAETGLVQIPHYSTAEKEFKSNGHSGN